MSVLGSLQGLPSLQDKLTRKLSPEHTLARLARPRSACAKESAQRADAAFLGERAVTKRFCFYQRAPHPLTPPLPLLFPGHPELRAKRMRVTLLRLSLACSSPSSARTPYRLSLTGTTLWSGTLCWGDRRNRGMQVGPSAGCPGFPAPSGVAAKPWASRCGEVGADCGAVCPSAVPRRVWGAYRACRGSGREEKQHRGRYPSGWGVSTEGGATGTETGPSPPDRPSCPCCRRSCWGSVQLRGKQRERGPLASNGRFLGVS